MLLATSSRRLLCFNSLLLGKTGWLGRARKNLLVANTNSWLLFFLPLLLSKNYCRLSPQCPSRGAGGTGAARPLCFLEAFVPPDFCVAW